MAKRLIIIGIAFLILINLNAINFLQEENILRARDGEHVIIAPAEFLTLAQQLADFYWDHFQILRVVVDQQDIFDQFSNGNPDPEVIRLYLIDFFDDPSIWLDSSVLLVGSGSLEWSIPDEKNRIVVTDFSDDDFVMLDDDNLPDIPIGRIPAQNVVQLERIINRNIQYISNPNFGWWNNKMLITADDEHKGGGLEGTTYNSGLNHTARAQDLADSLANSLWIDRILGIEYPMNGNGFKPEASQEIISRINEGRLIWHYIGHGSYCVLGDERYFDLSAQLQLLQNGNYLPLFTAASSKVGDFSSLSYDCIAEQFMTYEDGGSMASIAARRPTSGGSNSILFINFYQKIINDYYYLGKALLEAKLDHLNAYPNSKSYNILGDPLLFINPPQKDENISIIGNPEILYYGDQIQIESTLPANDYNLCAFKAFESEYDCYYTNTLNGYTYEINYTNFGEPFYEIELAVPGNFYGTSFEVEDGIETGDQARILCYISGDEEDFVQYIYPLTISDGTSSPDDPVQVNEVLLNNYPNPFNPSTTISFNLSADDAQDAELEIYNLKGQKMRTFSNHQITQSPNQQIVWDGTDNSGKPVSSGIYFARLKAKKVDTSRKMLLLK